VLVLWMGFGIGPKIVVIFLIAVFPIVISTATGLRSTPPEFLDLARSLSASQWQTFRRIRFPGALAQIFVGLKVAISLAVIGAVIGEFVGADEGLGYVIVISGGNVNTALAFAAMVLLSLISIVLFYALVALERLLVPWAERERQ
jgi:NitT/TauT family transport system permease protein